MGKINDFALFRACLLSMPSAVTIGSPTVVDPRGTGEGIALQETCRKKFYELEVALGICAPR